MSCGERILFYFWEGGGGSQRGQIRLVSQHGRDACGNGPLHGCVGVRRIGAAAKKLTGKNVYCSRILHPFQPKRFFSPPWTEPGTPLPPRRCRDHKPEGNNDSLRRREHTGTLCDLCDLFCSRGKLQDDRGNFLKVLESSC